MNKWHLESNNNQQGHPLLDKDIAQYRQSTPTLATSVATPPESVHHNQPRDKARSRVFMPKHTNKITNKFGCAEPERENLKGSNSEDKYNGQRETNPRGRNGNSSNDDYKEDPHNLWTLRQCQLSNSNPKSEPKPWPTNDGSQKPSWLPAHPVEKALQCVKWAPGSWCNHTKSLRYQTSTKIRYQLQVSQKAMEHTNARASSPSRWQ